MPECPECGSENTSDSEMYHECYDCGYTWVRAAFEGPGAVAADTLFVEDGEWQLFHEILSDSTHSSSVHAKAIEVDVAEGRLRLSVSDGSIMVERVASNKPEGET